MRNLNKNNNDQVTVLALASDFVGYSDLFPPKAKNRETEVSQGFRFFVSGWRSAWFVLAAWLRGVSPHDKEKSPIIWKNQKNCLLLQQKHFK